MRRAPFATLARAAFPMGLAGIAWLAPGDAAAQSNPSAPASSAPASSAPASSAPASSAPASSAPASSSPAPSAPVPSSPWRSTEAPPIAPDADSSAEQRPMVHPEYWTRIDPHPFVALTIDAGYLYLRPRASFGYGRPFVLWGGVDLNPIATSTGLGAYGGLRLQVPWFDVRVGARGFYAFQHYYLAPQAEYHSVDLNLSSGTQASYVTLEAELSGGIPAGPGSILLVLTASSVQGVPEGRFVYEETLRVITSPPAIYRARAGYALRLGSEGAARVGLVGEVLDLPDRHDYVIRAGVVASFAIDDHLEALGLLVIPVYGPDQIGISGGDFGELGLRYRWATGEGPGFL